MLITTLYVQGFISLKKVFFSLYIAKLLWLQPVLRHASRMLLHGCVGAHSIEQLVFLAVFLNSLTPAFWVASKHTTQHHKVCSSPWESNGKGQTKQKHSNLLFKSWGRKKKPLTMIGILHLNLPKAFDTSPGQVHPPSCVCERERRKDKTKRPVMSTSVCLSRPCAHVQSWWSTQWKQTLGRARQDGITQSNMGTTLNFEPFYELTNDKHMNNRFYQWKVRLRWERFH